LSAQRVIANAEMATIVDTSDEWIVQRTGIRQRYVAAEGETTVDAGDARRGSGAGRRRPDGWRHRPHRRCDLVARLHLPAVATQVQAALGMTHGVAFDLQASAPASSSLSRRPTSFSFLARTSARW